MHKPVTRTVRFTSADGTVIAEVSRLGLGNRGVAFTVRSAAESGLSAYWGADFHWTLTQTLRLLGKGARRLTP